jgi:hypothetical protein
MRASISMLNWVKDRRLTAKIAKENEVRYLLSGYQSTTATFGMQLPDTNLM